MDPRIADRRSAVQREHRRRRRVVLVVLLVVTALALTGIGLTRSAALDVDHIEVLGADRTNVDGLIGASGLSLGAPMTELDLNGARDAVAALPWIADVRIKRQWPNRISIAVRERTPVAVVPTADDRWALVDETGQILTVSAGASDRWIRLEGVDPATGPSDSLDADAEGALGVAAALPAELRGGVERISVDDAGQIELRFRTGQTARLGTADALDAKFEALSAVFDQVDDCGIDIIDARAVRQASDPITVTRVPDCQYRDEAAPPTWEAGAAVDEVAPSVEGVGDG
jgi:cell division protein FtsQ